MSVDERGDLRCVPRWGGYKLRHYGFLLHCRLRCRLRYFDPELRRRGGCYPVTDS